MPFKHVATICGTPLEISLYKAGRLCNEYEVRRPAGHPWPKMTEDEWARACEKGRMHSERVIVQDIDSDTKSVRVYREGIDPKGELV